MITATLYIIGIRYGYDISPFAYILPVIQDIAIAGYFSRKV